MPLLLCSRAGTTQLIKHGSALLNLFTVGDLLFIAVISVQQATMSHSLPDLPYEYGALEPYIDTQTMQIHHDRHHATYVNNLNAAVGKFPELKDLGIVELNQAIGSSKIPSDVATAVRYVTFREGPVRFEAQRRRDRRCFIESKLAWQLPFVLAFAFASLRMRQSERLRSTTPTLLHPLLRISNAHPYLTAGTTAEGT